MPETIKNGWTSPRESTGFEITLSQVFSATNKRSISRPLMIAPLADRLQYQKLHASVKHPTLSKPRAGCRGANVVTLFDGRIAECCSRRMRQGNSWRREPHVDTVTARVSMADKTWRECCYRRPTHIEVTMMIECHDLLPCLAIA